MNEIVLSCILFALVVLFIRCRTRDGFSPSNKPLEQENTLLMMNPFDNVDYQTPVFLAN